MGKSKIKPASRAADGRRGGTGHIRQGAVDRTPEVIEHQADGLLVENLAGVNEEVHEQLIRSQG